MNNFALQQHNCFGCGLKNDIGLKLHFTKKNNLIIGTCSTKHEHEGFPNILHGGIQTTILDEAMNWAFLIDGIFVFTTKIEIKFRAPVDIGQKITIEASVVELKNKIYTATGKIYLASGKLATESYGEFYLINDEKKSQILSLI
ncbi:MAG: hotdog fold domain-containing protein [Dehalococcoidia bacterium]|jgi:uncharacterized protein (TIGR00369 family)|nr:MAG: Acyl-coenzyme A thioesterase PaaI, contains HGG motif [Chloroflexota bacterium]|tara:strand:+ start:5844 stop:6275 length:432 start_codon:yes stop_codon:yes gene_type:complete